MKKLFLTLLFAFFAGLIFTAQAAGTDTDSDYQSQYGASGASGLSGALPDNTRQFLADIGADAGNPSVPFDFGTLLSKLVSTVTSGAAAPMRAAGIALAVMLLGCFIEGLGGPFQQSAMGNVYSFVCVLAISIAVLVPMLSCVTLGVGALQAGGVFMLTFVPVFAGILIAGGRVATAAGYQAVLFATAQVVEQIASNIAAPLLGMFMALSVSASVSPGMKLSGLSEGIKKFTVWTISVGMAVFVAILGVQNALNASTDTVASKTAKAVLGAAVPVVGSSLGDAFASVQSSVGILRSTVGIYAIVALALVFLPVVLQTLMWKFVAFACQTAADLFDLPMVGGIMKAASSAMTVLLALLLSCAALFIISTALLVMAGGGGAG